MLEVMSARDKVVYWLLVLVWTIVNVVFWSWWFQGEHIANLSMYVLMSVSLMYETTILPSVYLFYVGRMRRPIHRESPPGMKVAMITLCVPRKESINVIKRQLKVMVDVSYPHDSWVLDEDNDLRVQLLAVRYRVKYFSRKRVEKYNQPHPPFQAKTKAGNVNAWIDARGKDYEFFTQLDIDHNPRSDYLNHVLGHFGDEKVAWVQAPSIYGNLNQWTARGAAEQELVLQGPLQMGFYGWSKTPFIIGSHTTYRTSAIREIGGFQPTRAEDHLDTVVLARHGYEGVFVPEPIAKGDGPESFDTYLAQQFVWAYSMMQILFHYLPKYMFGYKKKQALQFVFAQTWYACWSTSMAILFVLPAIALLTNTPITIMSFGQFMLRYLPVWVVALIGWFWTRRWFQPKELMLSWRGLVLHVARWPIVLWALINVILGVKKPYMITTKGLSFGESRTLSLRSQIPYFGLVVFLFIALWAFLIGGRESRAQGYLLFVLEGVALFVGMYSMVLVGDIRSLHFEGVRMKRSILLRKKHISLLVVLWLGLIATGITAAPPIVRAITWTPLPIVQTPGFLESALTIRQIDKPMFNLTDGVVIGAYDPKGVFDHLPIAIQNTYVVWFLPDNMTNAIESSRRANRLPLVTLEPWPLLINGLTADTLLEDTNGGQYDEYIRQMARAVIAQSPQGILIRWGHEMELTGLYPWSQGNPEAYISAYQRVVNIFQEEKVTNVRWIWSPGGSNHSKEYYPGDNYVNYIGFTILADEQWEGYEGYSLRSFETLLSKNYRMAEEFNKPLIVAEAGVSTTDDLEKKLWLKEARVSFSNFPLLVAFVYFNDLNTHVQINHRPDWSVDQETFKEVFLDR